MEKGGPSRTYRLRSQGRSQGALGEGRHGRDDTEDSTDYFDPPKYPIRGRQEIRDEYEDEHENLPGEQELPFPEEEPYTISQSTGRVARAKGKGKGKAKEKDVVPTTRERVETGQLNRIYHFAQLNGFYDVLYMLPPAPDYFFVDADVTRNPFGRFNGNMLFLGGDENHNVFALLREFDESPAQVWLFKEMLTANGEVLDVRLKKVGSTEANIMQPFKAVADKNSDCQAQLKSLVKYIYLEARMATTAVFGKDVTAFPPLALAMRAIKAVYDQAGGPRYIQDMHPPSDLRNVGGASNVRNNRGFERGRVAIHRGAVSQGRAGRSGAGRGGVGRDLNQGYGNASAHGQARGQPPTRKRATIATTVEGPQNRVRQTDSLEPFRNAVNAVAHAIDTMERLSVSRNEDGNGNSEDGEVNRGRKRPPEEVAESAESMKRKMVETVKVGAQLKSLLAIYKRRMAGLQDGMKENVSMMNQDQLKEYALKSLIGEGCKGEELVGDEDDFP